MKKMLSATISAVIALSCALALGGCGGSGMLVTEPNTGIGAGTSESVGEYARTVYYELDRPADVKINFEADKLQKVSYKYRVLGANEYSFRGDTLTIKKSVFAGETAGDKRIRVFVDDMYTEIALRIVSKVIYTPADFDAIRTDLNGVFVLGADVDFGGASFLPIGRDFSGNNKPFEGVFDGMGHAVKNLVVNCFEYAGTNGEYQTGPNTGPQISNSANYNAGIFASTGGSAEIVNTNFVNITVNCQGLGGAVAGSNGGLIKNCRVSCTLFSRGECEKAGGIAGVNGSGDAAGRIENCIVTYTYGSGTPRGIADWNVGTIKNCFAAAEDNFVYYPDYNYETGKRDPEFSYDHYLNSENWTQWIYTNYSLPAFPGTVDTSTWTYYPGGRIVNSDVVTKQYLLHPANFPAEDGWDNSIWDFTYGMFPTLKVQER